MSETSPLRPARAPSVADYIQGVRSGDRSMLARAVTLIESRLPAHQAKAREVLQALLPYSGQALRVGLTGPPGVGKSTLIEAFGQQLLAAGKRLAVLAVDPSSSLSRGSILGDKTRMQALSKHPGCFIRPSPSGGALGGVARSTRETILLCEAAGYDLILIETVGVGQSEISVREMVDAYVLLLLAGAGDELQGIKKGVMEMADILAITKADGQNLIRARQTQQECRLTLKYLRSFTPDWDVPVLLLSALENTGLNDLWQALIGFEQQARQRGHFAQRRRQQQLSWFEDLLREALWHQVLGRPSLQQQYQALRRQVASGQCWPLDAVQQLLGALP
ncbi:MAG: methylmalonyl Co-A mutase-associated GTPase MeaB [Candidatus Sericytochromatia bacterium]|nr:methylmalonyl Co-A mutase-associated GTPase MeaB [Candidatus Sericytochromatia bacterium]